MPSLPILDSTIFYREAGDGTPFVFLHGNPASSYVWRKVIPAFGAPGHSVAPDLIGMGQSGKPGIGYRFADHARYLDAWFDALALDGVVLVGHDWGGALAMDWAARHSERVRGLVLMETILRPLHWDDFPASHRARYEALRGAGSGEATVLDENFFIEQALKVTIRSGLSPADHDVYRQPYPDRESRRPLLAWPREMPIEGAPADTVARIDAYAQWLGASPETPKLLLTFDGSDGTLMIGPEMIRWARDTIASLDIGACGPAGHMCPEDQPQAIGSAIAGWADCHGLR
ncbi:haloalkane dehalogenase [Sphingomonas alpina]|uniref:Haloalkane dehalogenase n=1 Tax=Sphingomonas alpina TaxID=653931 RepID=A0A7H0LL54_9SPHN|nr:haloalkane dehalogenase [Sphingomonas alpina]QNQ10407.1 haloalkane dehalogenase [Sphingomonas alpina]